MQILFVCTGNTCRSPMAECYARACLQQANRVDIECSSAGIAAMCGDSASQHAIELMASINLDLSLFRSRRLSYPLLETADKIVVMGESHRRAIINSAPEFADKIMLLMSNGDIPDPYGGDLDHYRSVFETMKLAIENLIDNLILK